MVQQKSILIDGIRVIWNGYSIEYRLPVGCGGLELRAFIEKNERKIKEFRKLCKK